MSSIIQTITKRSQISDLQENDAFSFGAFAFLGFVVFAASLTLFVLGFFAGHGPTHLLAWAYFSPVVPMLVASLYFSRRAFEIDGEMKSTWLKFYGEQELYSPAGEKVVCVAVTQPGDRLKVRFVDGVQIWFSLASLMDAAGNFYEAAPPSQHEINNNENLKDVAFLKRVSKNKWQTTKGLTGTARGANYSEGLIQLRLDIGKTEMHKMKMLTAVVSGEQPPVLPPSTAQVDAPRPLQRKQKIDLVKIPLDGSGEPKSRFSVFDLHVLELIRQTKH